MLTVRFLPFLNCQKQGYEIKRDFTNFSLKISKGLKRPQEKFVHQMVYGILAGNRLHLSEIARSLKENITLKKTIDRLSKNLNAFDGKDSLMHNYLSLVKQHVKDDYAVIIIKELTAWISKIKAVRLSSVK